MNKQQVIDKVEKAWNDFHQSYAGLRPDQMIQPGVDGAWSVRDLLAHVSWWEDELLQHLPEILAGIRPQRYSVLYGGIDAFNALMTEKWAPLTLAEVQHKVHETHAKVIAYLQSVPEEHFKSGSKFRRRILLDTYGHYPYHAKSIRDWREKNG
ncbi:ClbS/DfsB family four-helix bundle protein [bacterium]|nr:ClbS/DfsB family four-helix bundle protein [bacterium]